MLCATQNTRNTNFDLKHLFQITRNMRDSKNSFLFFEQECRSIVIPSKMQSVLELPYGSDRNIAFAIFLSGISIIYDCQFAFYFMPVEMLAAPRAAFP